MRTWIISLAALLPACTAPEPATSGAAAIPELAGRVAGSPQRCVTIEQREGLRIAGPHAVIYGNGRTIYLNPLPGCSPLKYSDILVLEPFGSRYCRGDFLRTRDNVTRLPGPGCRLGDFVPYTRG